MDYKRFYNLYKDYNFMLLKAVHFGVYSENLFISIQVGLERCICDMLLETKCLEYKNFLKELYESVIKGEDISGFLPLVNELCKKMAVRKALRVAPVFTACFCLFIITGIILKITVFY